MNKNSIKLIFHPWLKVRQPRHLWRGTADLIMAFIFFAMPCQAAIIDEINVIESPIIDMIKEGNGIFAPVNPEILFPNDKLSVQEELKLILKHLHDKQYDQALKLSEKLRGMQPTNLDALNLMATAYMGKGDNVRAQKYFKEVLTVEPGNPFASAALGAMAIDAKDNKLARAYYEQALEKNPGHLAIVLQLGRLEYREGNQDKLKSLLVQAIETHPDKIELLIMLAAAYLQEGNPSKANELLQESLARFPDNPSLLNFLGQTQLDLRQPDKAIVSFQRWADIQPQSAEARFMLALAYAKTNNKDKFGKTLKEALGLDPNHLRAKTLMVRLAMMEGKSKMASNLIMELSRTYPNNSAVLAQEGWLAEQLKEPQKAISAYKAALKITPNSQQLISHLALAQLNAGDVKAALATLGEWLDRYPDDLQARFMRAKVLYLQGQQKETVADYEHIIEKMPDNIFTLNALGWLLRQDNPKKALIYAERALKLAPNNPAVMDTLGMVLLSLNDTATALDLISKASEKMPSNLPITYHLALAQARNDQADAAKATLKKLLEAGGQFPERMDARKLLENLMK